MQSVYIFHRRRLAAEQRTMQNWKQTPCLRNKNLKTGKIATAIIKNS